MKALTAALILHALFGLGCLYRAAVRGEWVQSGCAFLVASSGGWLAVGMFRALRKAEAQFERRERADERRRAFRETVKADHGRGAGAGHGKSSGTPNAGK